MWIVLIIVNLITACYANSKGYNGVLWFFAGGVIGLIILLVLPNANAPEHSPSERERLAGNGNTIGGVIVGISVIIGIMIGINIAS